jgi:hypothetical protein
MENKSEKIKKNEQHTATTQQEKSTHLESPLQRLKQRLINKTQEWRKKFSRRHHYLYIFIAFIGVTMVWYAVWDIISETPIINNPWVAGGIGLAILLILGKFFDRLV